MLKKNLKRGCRQIKKASSLCEKDRIQNEMSWHSWHTSLK